MARKFDETLLDKRVVKKYIERGFLSKEDYDDYLRSLKDESSNAEQIDLSDKDLAFVHIEPKGSG